MGELPVGQDQHPLAVVHEVAGTGVTVDRCGVIALGGRLARSHAAASSSSGSGSSDARPLEPDVDLIPRGEPESVRLPGVWCIRSIWTMKSSMTAAGVGLGVDAGHELHDEHRVTEDVSRLVDGDHLGHRDAGGAEPTGGDHLVGGAGSEQSALLDPGDERQSVRGRRAGTSRGSDRCRAESPPPTRSPGPSSSLRNPARRNCCSGVIGDRVRDRVRHGSARAAPPRRRGRRRDAARAAARSRSRPRIGRVEQHGGDVVVTDQRGDRGVTVSAADRRLDRGRNVASPISRWVCERGERIVDVGQHRRSQRLDHRRPQRVLRRSTVPDRSPLDHLSRRSERRSTRRTYRERSMRGRIAVAGSVTMAG